MHHGREHHPGLVIDHARPVQALRKAFLAHRSSLNPPPEGPRGILAASRTACRWPRKDFPSWRVALAPCTKPAPPGVDQRFASRRKSLACSDRSSLRDIVRALRHRPANQTGAAAADTPPASSVCEEMRLSRESVMITTNVNNCRTVRRLGAAVGIDDSARNPHSGPRRTPGLPHRIVTSEREQANPIKSQSVPASTPQTSQRSISSTRLSSASRAAQLPGIPCQDETVMRHVSGISIDPEGPTLYRSQLRIDAAPSASRPCSSTASHPGRPKRPGAK